MSPAQCATPVLKASIYLTPNFGILLAPSLHLIISYAGAICVVVRQKTGLRAQILKIFTHTTPQSHSCYKLWVPKEPPITRPPVLKKMLHNCYSLAHSGRPPFFDKWLLSRCVNRDKACIEISMEAITDGNVRRVFACRLIFGPCNLLHKRHKGLPTEECSYSLPHFWADFWTSIAEESRNVISSSPLFSSWLWCCWWSVGTSSLQRPIRVWYSAYQATCQA